MIGSGTKAILQHLEENCREAKVTDNFLQLQLLTEWLIRRAMFPLSVASTTTSSLILNSCKIIYRKRFSAKRQKRKEITEDYFLSTHIAVFAF